MVITEIDFENGKKYKETFDFSEGSNIVMMAYLYFANGLPPESRAEFDDAEMHEVVRGLILGGGDSEKIEITEEIKNSSKLYQPNDECYRQGSHSYFFINPVVQKL